MYYERLMSLAGLEKRAYQQNGYGVNGQQNPPGAPLVKNQYDRNGNVNKQTYTYTEDAGPWRAGDWHRREGGKGGYAAGQAIGNGVRDFTDSLQEGLHSYGKSVGKAWDAAGRGLASGAGAVGGWWDRNINGFFDSAYDVTRGAYHGIKDTFSRPGWQPPEEIDEKRRAEDAQRKANVRQSVEARKADLKARADEYNKIMDEMDEWYKADPEAYRRYKDEEAKAGYLGVSPGHSDWESAAKFRRDALAKWQASRNQSQQQPAPAPAPGAPQVQQPSQQQPAQQTATQQPAPAPGAPQVQQPSQQQQPAQQATTQQPAQQATTQQSAGTQTPQAPQTHMTQEEWRQRMDNWNKKFNNVTQGVKPYVDHLNSRPQTPKPASTPAQPAAGAPTVQQPTATQTPKPSTSQAPKTTANTNWQDPGQWNNNRPTGRQGY